METPLCWRCGSAYALVPMTLCAPCWRDAHPGAPNVERALVRMTERTRRAGFRIGALAEPDDPRASPEK